MNKKVKITNDYSDWTYRDRVNMHRLKLKHSERFIWSNLLWFELFLYVFTGSLFLVIAFLIPTFLVLCSIAHDVEYI